MNVYFDTSCLGRPFDNQSISRNAVEREAMVTMLEMVERGEFSLTISDVVVDEISRTPDELRRQQLSDVAALATAVVPVNREVSERGAQLQRRGFTSFDALHIAAAEMARVTYLCTADDRLKKQAAKQPDLKLRVVSVLELFQELKS
jgi:predicted nucleic acid-binding protein